MKVFLLGVLLALAPPQAAQDTITIEGRVLRAGSHDPIANVQVSLLKSTAEVTMTAETVAALDTLQQIVSSAPRGISRPYLDSLVATREQELGLPPGTFAQVSSSATAITDAAGRFSFKNQAPGTYGIRATLEGYFGEGLNGAASATVTKSVIVEAARPAPSTEFLFVKGGIVAGSVRDANGQAVSGMDVLATRLTYYNGRPQWTAAAAVRQTDERGGFRIFWLPPGEYAVAATRRDAMSMPDSSTRVFYPGVTDPSAATRLVVKDGSEIAGIDFALPAIVPAATYKIRGTATNPLAVPNASGVMDPNANWFFMVPREPGTPNYGNTNQPMLQNSISPQARPNGEFEIRNVLPGSYDLFIYYSLPADLSSRRYYMDRAQVEVRDSDVEGVSLQIQKGSEIRGKVVSQGATALRLDRIKISLRSQDTMPDAYAIIVGAIPVNVSGDFSAPGIPSARYSLQFSGLPENAYVADIRQGAGSVFNAGFVVDRQPAVPLEIVVNANGGRVDGNVQTSDRKPAPGTTVVLIPPPGDRQNAMKYKSVEADDKGHFSLKGVAPGEYTLFAWESVSPTAWMNADFIAKYQNRGRRVLLSQGTLTNVELDQIPDEVRP